VNSPPVSTRPALLDSIQTRLVALTPPRPPPPPAAPVIELETDLLVAGGGLAGVCAALAAARHGARVVLVQDRSRLGGNSSSEVRMHVVGANWHKNRPGWREGGILEELRLDDAVNNPQRCRELWDVLLYDKVVSEPNLTLLLDSVLHGVELADGRITHARVRCEAAERAYRIRARLFCDCTGDSRLSLEAGAEFRRGREARAEFGESLAPERADGEMLGSSILFTARNHGRPMPFVPPVWARRITREQLRRRTIKSWEYGYWWIEWGGHLDTIADHPRIRHELMAIALGIWDYIKNSGEVAGTADWALEWVGMVPGKRESRRIVGDHLLTQADLLGGGDFHDAVAIGGWPMDDHPPGGFDSTDASPGRQVATRDVYGIPLRSLYSRNVPNLLMAGRNISATHVAFTSTRVMGTCSAMGQAAGTAAALCVRHGLDPRELAHDAARLAELRQALLRADQTLKGVRNEDPADLARSAAVTASGEGAGTTAGNVIDGWLRDAPGDTVRELPEQDVPLEVASSGAPPPPALHHWAGPMGPDGAWLELRWPQPVTVREIQITFDTGFQRELTLTSSDHINQGIIRGPQPETVRDYALLGFPPGGGAPFRLAEVRGNHQRVNRHRLAAVALAALRIHVTATNGAPSARVFEIRCYS
jgi:glycine/D-amino acid oxidase-like deaminating enzyme